MGAVVFILCLLSCLPLYANEVSELKDQVAELQEQVTTQQEQILELQRQMRHLMEDEGEPPLVEHPRAAEAAVLRREPRVSFKLKPGYYGTAPGTAAKRVFKWKSGGGVDRDSPPRWT